MARTTALEFQHKFGEHMHQAQREPVEITRHDRREFVVVSAEHYDWLKAAAQHSHRIEAATEIVVAASVRTPKTGRRLSRSA